MLRRVRWYLVGSGAVALGGLVTLVGCSTHFFVERAAWRRDAEIACLNSGAVREGPGRVRISPINGPGMCGADFPLKVSELGDRSPIGYSDEAIRPPGAVPNSASMPQPWPGASPAPGAEPRYSPIDARPLPPVDPRRAASPYPSGRDAPDARSMAQPEGPVSLSPPGVADPDNDEPLPAAGPAGPPSREPYGQPGYGAPHEAYPPQPQAVPLGPSRGMPATGSIGPVEVKPAATLACPIVSALDQWISGAVQPAAMRWFGKPVIEIKQISAYSCRGMNGNPNAHISEHAFGNALDVAAFIFADGSKLTVQYGWHGTPEEQGFLHDVQAAACEQFTTVLAPGANVYHYNHIHVDLMRHASRRHICEPRAIPGDVVAERVRARFAAQHGDPGVTGSIRRKRRGGALGYSGENDGRLPLAIPGDD